LHGMKIVNAAPPSSEDETSIQPSCSSTMP
jgi:hypothetical protein